METTKLYTYSQLSNDAKLSAYMTYLDLVNSRQTQEYLSIDKFCDEFGIDYEIEDDEPYTQPTYATSNYDDIDYSGKKLAKYIIKTLTDMEAYPQPSTDYPFDKILLQPLYDFIEQPTDDDTFGSLLYECLTNALEVAQEDYNQYCNNDMFLFKCRKDNLLFYENGEICA